MVSRAVEWRIKLMSHTNCRSIFLWTKSPFHLLPQLIDVHLYRCIVTVP